MKFAAIPVPLLSAMCICSVIGPASANEDEELASLLSDRWIEAYDTLDADLLSKIYAEDARVISGACPAYVGREAIADFWRIDLGIGSPATRLEVTDEFTSGDLTYLYGNYLVSENDHAGKLIGGGQYMQLWRRISAEEWTLVREQWMGASCIDIRIVPRESGSEGPDSSDLSV